MKKVLPILAILLSAGLILSGCKSNKNNGGGHCTGNTCTVGRNVNSL